MKNLSAYGFAFGILIAKELRFFVIVDPKYHDTLTLRRRRKLAKTSWEGTEFRFKENLILQTKRVGGKHIELDLKLWRSWLLEQVAKQRDEISFTAGEVAKPIEWKAFYTCTLFQRSGMLGNGVLAGKDLSNSKTKHNKCLVKHEGKIHFFLYHDRCASSVISLGNLKTAQAALFLCLNAVLCDWNEYT